MPDTHKESLDGVAPSLVELTPEIQPNDEIAALATRVEAVRTALVAIIESTSTQESRHLTYVHGRVHAFRESTERNLLRFIADVRPDELLVYLNYNIESTQSNAAESEQARVLRADVEKFDAVIYAIEVILRTMATSQTGVELITSAIEAQGYTIDTSNTQDFGPVLVEYIQYYADRGKFADLDRATSIEFSALVAQAVLEIIEPYRDLVVAILESSLDEKDKKRLLFKLVSLDEDSWPGLFTDYLTKNPWLAE